MGEKLDSNITQKVETNESIINNTQTFLQKLKQEFNYKEPEYDSNGLLVARKDLKTAKEISNGYNSIKELFKKLNSMQETQIEPEFAPIYYGEIDKETGEKIPTYIIIGDIHADEYNVNLNNDITFISLRQEFKDNLIERDETYKPEVDVLKILKEKFDIKNIGLENEYSSEGENYSLIGIKATSENIKYIGLEDKEVQEKIIQNLKNTIEEFISFLIKQFELYGVDISDYNITKDEYKEIFEDDILKKIILFNYNNSSTLEKKNFLKSINNLPINKKAKLYKYFLSNFIKTFIHEDKNTYIAKKIKNLKDYFNNGLNLSEFIDMKIKFDKEFISKFNKETIHTRNAIGIKKISENMGEDKISAIVYGKMHIPNLIKQLIEKYDGKVNIYVAK